MRVLQIYKDYYPPVIGGIEGHINLLSSELKTLGVDVEVLVSNTSRHIVREKVNGISVTKVPEYGRLNSAPINFTLPFWMKELARRADILHFHFPNPTAEIAYLLTGMKKPFVVTYHSDIVRQAFLKRAYLPFMNRFLRSAHTIIATSRNYLSSSRTLQKFICKCKIVPLGIDVERFNGFRSIDRNVLNIRNKFGPSIVLFVGRLRYYKGLQVLIDAMKDVEGKLLIIGDGCLENKMKHHVKSRHLEGKIDFLGALSDADVAANLKACDVFVLPSVQRSEAFGVAQIEAMACGKPVISTELGTGTSFVNCHKQTGIVVPPNDAKSMATAINLLLRDPEKRAAYGQAGLDRVRTFFTKESMVRKICAVYQSALDDVHI